MLNVCEGKITLHAFFVAFPKFTLGKAEQNMKKRGKQQPEVFWAKAAAQYGVSMDEVTREMQKAIDAAWDNPDPAIRKKQMQLFPHGRPTITEFIRGTANTQEIQYISNKYQLGTNMRHIRLYHDYTHNDLARVLNMERSTYSYYELGRSLPSIFTLIQLARFYEVDIRYFLLPCGCNMVEDFIKDSKRRNNTI